MRLNLCNISILPLACVSNILKSSRKEAYKGIYLKEETERQLHICFHNSVFIIYLRALEEFIHGFENKQ